MRRREVIGGAVGAGLAWATRARATPATGRLTLPEGADGPSIPGDFIGLSYECQELASPANFAPENTGLVAAFRAVATRGVLRLGGNTSEFSWWREHPDDAPPRRTHAVTRQGEPRADTLYAITPAAVDALAGFLRATDWRCIYGLNLGQGEPAALAREAAYVRRALGERLLMFAIGNEPDLYGRHLRDPARWGVAAYLDDWLPAARAVLDAVPDARFSAPEVSAAFDWMPAVAERLSQPGAAVPVAAMSHHFYWGGPPTNPDVNTARLLEPDARVERFTTLARTAARRLGATPRLTEANTCYRGGKPGVSDVNASALWAADLALRLMGEGYAGLNLHGGSASAVGASVGGLPGDAMRPDDTPRPRPYYTPIALMDGAYALQPDAQGLRLAGLFAGARARACRLEAGGLNAEAYAARRDDGAVLVAVLNKDAARPLSVSAPRHRPWATLSGSGATARDIALRFASDQAPREQLTLPPLSAAAIVIV